MIQLTEESKENEWVARKGVDLHSNETHDPGNQHFSKDDYLSSTFLSVDTVNNNKYFNKKFGDFMYLVCLRSFCADRFFARQSIT
jgi:hypothetical protein